ncbi:MAG: MarR family transcriptional regulator [Bacteroidetes bacterium]|nr:MAG: MarR family transcriptional regulator [Bacteroidota bacterium]
MNYSLVHQILNWVESYENTTKNSENYELSDVLAWIQEQINAPKKEIPAVPFTLKTENLESEITALIISMYRYGKNYIKKALADTPLQTSDDFTYLVSLMKSPMTKTALIDNNIQEKPTGIEIIKRLLKNQWIEEENNPKDKRSKLVFLTEKGRNTLLQTFEKMLKVSEIIAADLELTEKWQLLFILKKLEAFHKPIFLNQKNNDWNELKQFFDKKKQ